METNNLKKYAEAYGIHLSNEMLFGFEFYEKLLLEWNEKINLTAITDHEEITVKHFLDSLLLLKAADVPQGASLIDVGTGAGFPGVPVKLARPDIRLTLLDSLNKRVTFLSELSDGLSQNNEIIHGRAEQLSREKTHREQYDLATARAVAAFPVLCEYCLPFVKTGGIFAALKGPDGEEEAVQAASALKALGGEIADIKSFDLPNGNQRCIILVKKISQTPARYPRIPAKIAKTPL